MKFKLVITITMLLSFFNYTNLKAQNKETTSTENKAYIKSLTKANLSEAVDKPIRLDGESFPIYDVNYNRIRGVEMKKVLVSGDYTPEFFMDKNREIKAAVLRVSTLEEKEAIEKMKARRNTIDTIYNLIGKDAIPFYVKDLNGNEYSLDNLKGKIIVVNFWFVECKPCIIEMPELNELVKKYESNDVVFLGFASSNTSKIDSFLKKKEFLYTIIPNSEEIAKDYTVLGYPTHIVIDQSSKVNFVTTGLGPTTIQDIVKSIDNLIQK